MIHREADIIQWGEARNIYAGSSARQQFKKLDEEVLELKQGLVNDDRDEVIDAIGDCIVVLTHISRFYNLTLEECIEHAWHQIKDRTGRMVNGVFVKDAP